MKLGDIVEASVLERLPQRDVQDLRALVRPRLDYLFAYLGLIGFKFGKGAANLDDLCLSRQVHRNPCSPAWFSGVLKSVARITQIHPLTPSLFRMRSPVARD